MTDTTSIHDLPTDPANGGSIQGNIQMYANEIDTNNNNNIKNISLDQTTINQIVNGLQQASSSGATVLPSRDIPQNTSSLTQDPYTKPNYIAETSSTLPLNFIEEEETTENIINKYHHKENQQSAMDILYDEIQQPLLMIILYFIFQLPIFKHILFHYIPFLFNKDGNINVYGLLFTSISYGFIFYILEKMVHSI